MPLLVDIGNTQAFNWGTQASGLQANSPGIVKGGNFGPRYPIKRIHGIGQRESRRQGLAKNIAHLQVAATSDTKNLWPVRSGGALPYVRFICGAPQLAWLYTNAKCGKAKWAVDQLDGEVTMDFDFMALVGAAGTYAAQVAETSNPYMGYNLTLTVAGSDYGGIKASGEVDFNLKTGVTLGSRSANSIRQPSYIVEHFEQHKVSITTLMPIAEYTPGLDQTAEIGLVASFGGPGAWVFTYANLAFDDESGVQEVAVEGEPAYKYNLVGGPGCLTIT